MSRALIEVQADTWLTFGRFSLSRSRKLLLNGEHPVHIGGRALEILLILAEHRGQAVPHDVLLARVWPSSVVEDNTLRVHMSALRRALGAGGEGCHIINVPGCGYRLGTPVEERIVQSDALSELDRTSPAIPLPLRTEAPIGRDEDCAAIGRLLSDRRMVSLIGPGGIGKTTVALTVAAARRAEFRNGVAFVDLSPLSSPHLIAAAMAAALDISVPGDREGNGICNFLHDCDLLLVLDNCEHLADAVALLVEKILHAAPAVRILATSREALFVCGETVFRLPPLSVPDEPPQEACQSGCSPALELFARRACKFVPGFVLDSGNQAVIESLCRKLDGIPLAIELAAARLDRGGVGELAARLEALFNPGSGVATVSETRHGTLHALFDWSWRLLDADERIVLASLSVFRAGFTLDSAVELCTCPELSPSAVKAALLGLTVKSLVTVQVAADPPMYRLLNTTRMYAARQLGARGEQARVRSRHAQCMVGLFKRADAELKTLPASQWQSVYGHTAGDFHAALEWAFGPDGEPILGAELIAASSGVMLEFGRIGDYHSLVQQALALIVRATPPRPELELRLLSALSMIAGHCDGGPGEQDAVFRRMRVLMTASPDLSTRTETLHSMAAWAFGQGNYPLVQVFINQVAVDARRSGDPAASLLADRLGASCLHFLGDHIQAQILCERALASRVAQRNAHLLGQVPRAVSMRTLQARILWLSGRADEAVQRVGEAIELADGEHPFAICQPLGLAAIPIALWRGEEEKAARLCKRLEGVARRHSLEYWYSWVESFRRVIALRSGASMGDWQWPSNAKQADLIATLHEALAAPGCLGRVEHGTVGWCGPEVLRVEGERRLRTEGDDAAFEAEAIFLRALGMARNQGALAWELRVACSLASLWEGSGRAPDAAALLRGLLPRFEQGLGTADLRRARQLLAQLGA